MQFAYVCDKGLIREKNEDYYYVPKDNEQIKDLFIVADGIGGHKAGDYASHLAVDSIVQFFNVANQSDPVMPIDHKIRRSIRYANAILCDESEQTPQLKGMGTTITSAVATKTNLNIGNVGDSRAYLFHDKTLTQITTDHSLVQSLFEKGEITKDEMLVHPQKNVITRAVGSSKFVDLDSFSIPWQTNDCLFMTTDGLLKHVSEKEITNEISNTLDLNQCLTNLLDLAKSRGGIDNITMILVANN